MGVSSDGILVYGYDFGGEEAGWRLEEYDPKEYVLRTEWYDSLSEDDESPDFKEAALDRLLKSVGFAEEYTPGIDDGYFARKREAEALTGVDIALYCSFDYPLYILSAHEIKVYRGEAKPIDFEALSTQAVLGNWDFKLNAALEALGLTPKDQPGPQWWLASLYG